MPPTKPNEKTEKRYIINLTHNIEFAGVVYEKGNNVAVPRALAILQGEEDADPIAEPDVIAPETVQSQVQTQIGDLVTRLQESERTNGNLQTQLAAVQAERDALAAQLEQAFKPVVPAATEVKTETGLTQNPQPPVQA